MLNIVFYIVIVILTLVGVVLILMLINHFLLPLDDHRSSTDRLKRDVDNDDSVISHDSLFHSFLVRDGESMERRAKHGRKGI